MSQRSGPPPIVYIVIFLVLLGGGLWWFTHRSPSPVSTVNNTQTPAVGSQTSTNSTTPNPSNNPTSFAPPTSVPQGTTIKISGSTSMVTINQNLKKAFEGQFPGTNVITTADGSDKGIQNLKDGTSDIAAVSRPLSSQEQSQGLVAVPVKKDAIAIIVNKSNPFNIGLTSAQVTDIFQGKINNWSAVGGKSQNIRVINRPTVSGTRTVFQELVLKGANFGTTPDFITLADDGTTILFQALRNDGIGYSTYAQAANQQTVRILPIDGLSPEAANYPYQRQLTYVYKNPASPAVQAFLGYVTGPSGQQATAN